MNLFNTLARRQSLLGQIEAADGELSNELEDALRISDDRVQEGVLQLVGLRETAQGNIVAAKAEQERLKEFIASNERAVERFNGYLLDATLRLGPLVAGTYRIGTRPSSVAVVSEGATLPTRFLRHIPAVAEQYKPDLTALAKALRAGEVVEGAHLENRANLVVK